MSLIRAGDGVEWARFVGSVCRHLAAAIFTNWTDKHVLLATQELWSYSRFWNI